SLQQSRKFVQGNRIRTVTERRVRVFMNFHEDTVNSCSNCRPRQILHKLALAARAVSMAAGELHTVGGIEYHRIAGGAHDRKTAHVHNKVVIAERSPAFREDDVLVASG